MEPRIQYAKTTDGVNIAFWALGEGTPLVETPDMPWSHIQQSWQQWPEGRSWSERRAEERCVIEYDNRGSGLSDRSVTDYSLDAHVLDLEAIIDHLGLERFALEGTYHSGPVAIAYAARHPERVSQLILWCTFARAPDHSQRPQVQAFRPLIDEDWQLYTETRAHIATGYSEGDQAHRLAAFMRECVTPEAARAIYRAIDDFDVTDLLPQVSSPTLIVHRREFLPLDLARELASRIPKARLVVLEGASLLAWVGDAEAAERAYDEFLGEGEEAEAPQAGAVHTILFTDIESSTALTQRLGDAKAQELLRAHNTIVRDALASQGGREIKHTGDGIMVSFPSASRALECGIAIQRAVAALRQAQGGQAEPVEAPLRVRIGLNSGEPVAEEADLFGASVQLARRVCDHADPGQIVASNVVRELATGKGFLFSDLGDVVPKGFEDPVKLWEVRWREEG